MAGSAEQLPSAPVVLQTSTCSDLDAKIPDCAFDLRVAKQELHGLADCRYAGTLWLAACCERARAWPNLRAHMWRAVGSTATWASSSA